MLKRQNLKLKQRMHSLEKALAEVDQAANGPFYDVR